MQITLALLIVLAACESLRPRAEPTPDQRFDARWRGHSEDDLILRYGRPNDVVQLSSGNHVDSFRAENAVSSSSAALYRGSGGSSSESETIYCERRFEIDHASGVVVRATILGNGCDYAK